MYERRVCVLCIVLLATYVDNKPQESVSHQSETSNKCILPPYPAYGSYVANDAEAEPGKHVRFALLTYTCSDNYSLDIKTNHLMCVNGIWSDKFPQCAAPNELNFLKSGNEKSSGSDYKRQDAALQLNILQYTLNGIIEKLTPLSESIKSIKSEIANLDSRIKNLEEGIKIIPSSQIHANKSEFKDCGTVPSLEDSETNSARLAVPWHAGIYQTTTRPYMQICGGSIVTTKVVISGAHCFWTDIDKKQPASKYAVAVGKVIRSWNNSKDIDAQKSEVSEIKIPRRFLGSDAYYQNDIAIVIVNTPFVFNTFVKPVCLDFDHDFDKRQLQVGNYGRVAGWGLTEANGKPSQLLRATDLPYEDIEVCQVNAPSAFLNYITSDKICAGSTTGSALCKGDSGGGLAFPEYENGVIRYYIRGVVSTAPNNEHSCNLNTYVYLTHIQAHAQFIKDSIN